MYILRIYNQIKPLLSNVCRTKTEEVRLHKYYLEYLLNNYEYSIELMFKDHGNYKAVMDSFVDMIIKDETNKLNGLSYEAIENLIIEDEALKKLQELSNQIFEQARRKKLMGTFNTSTVYASMEAQVLGIYERVRPLNKETATPIFNETLADLKYLYNKSEKQSARLLKETAKEIGLIDTVLDDCRDLIGNTYKEVEIRSVLVKLYSRYKDLSEEYKYALCAYYIYAITKENNFATHSADILTNILSWDEEQLKSEVMSFKWEPYALKRIIKLSNDLFEQAKNAYLFFNIANPERVDACLNEILKLGKTLNTVNYVYRDKAEILNIYDTILAETKIDAETSKGARDIQSKRLCIYMEQMANTF